MASGPAEWRKLAEECCRNAENFNNGLDRVRWLRIAEGWMVLAHRLPLSSNAHGVMDAPKQPEHPKVRLKNIPAPAIGEPLVHAPPTLIASTHTIDFDCASCGAVLLHSEEEQVHNLVIHCQRCGCYNSTDT